MGRIYESAERLAARAGIDEDRLEELDGTGAEGAVTREDVAAYLAGKKDEKPTQAEIIRSLVLEGESNREIAQAVREVHPESSIKPSHVSWEVGHQRRQESHWWNQHRERIGEVRPQTKGTPEAEEKS